LAKITSIINVGSSLESSLKAKELSQRFEYIFFSAGQHPHYADKFPIKDDLLKKQLDSLFDSKKLVAIGEIGLDYYRNLSDRYKQKEVFRYFVSIAKKLNLALIIHCRESQEDIYSILKEELADFTKVVFHCFSATENFFNKCYVLGAMFSFTANFTYPNASNLRELIKKIPLERIMLETDSPYLAPQKYRGQRNEPSYIHLIAQELALIKNIPFEEVANKTTQNAERFFKLNG
jgi:TatD DNase family protein